MLQQGFMLFLPLFTWVFEDMSVPAETGTCALDGSVLMDPQTRQTDREIEREEGREGRREEGREEGRERERERERDLPAWVRLTSESEVATALAYLQQAI
jgi:hypothetical protein